MTRRLVNNWFEVWEIEPDVFAIEEPFHEEKVKSYLVVGSDLAVLIDTGMGVGDIGEVARSVTQLPISVINSHAHWDHIGGNWRFTEIAIHRSEAAALSKGRTNSDIRKKFEHGSLSAPLPPDENLDTVEIRPSVATRLLDGGELFDLGGRTLEVVHAPGHSPGGIVLVDTENGIMFSTDVVYAGKLYAQFPDSSLDDYISTLDRLAPIASNMLALYPSHGETPIDPALVKKMRGALVQVRDGRLPGETGDQIAIHRFPEFGVIVADASGSESGT